MKHHTNFSLAGKHYFDCRRTKRHLTSYMVMNVNIFIDDFGLGVSRELSEYNRYQMVGEEGREWNLLINNATIDDDAKYQCQVGN